jgi:TPP-dependent pyruvate/acetoin dehydrogenase alpha subunit
MPVRITTGPLAAGLALADQYRSHFCLIVSSFLQVPLGAGLALAHHYRDDGGVAVAMYGDGAANQVGREPARLEGC